MVISNFTSKLHWGQMSSTKAAEIKKDIYNAIQMELSTSNPLPRAVGQRAC